MSWIEPRMGKELAVYVLDYGSNGGCRMLITASGSTNIRLGWYPIGNDEFNEALALEKGNSDGIDEFCKEMLNKYEKRMVA